MNYEGTAWAAGLFEGEGCISLVKGYVHLVLKMTDEEIVRRFHRVIGVGSVHGPHYSPNPRHLPQWRWVACSTHDITTAFEAMRPYLGKRRCEKYDAARAVRPNVTAYRPKV
jgi:hypothetical protein